MNTNERNPVIVTLHDYAVTFYHPRSTADFTSAPGESDESIAKELAAYRQANHGNKQAKSSAITPEQSRAWETVRRAIKDSITDTMTLAEIRAAVRSAWVDVQPKNKEGVLVECPTDADFAKLQTFADTYDMLAPVVRRGAAPKVDVGTEKARAILADTDPERLAKAIRTLKFKGEPTEANLAAAIRAHLAGM